MTILITIAAIILAFAFGRLTKQRPRVVFESEVVEGLRSMFVKDLADLDARLLDQSCGWSEGDAIRQARAMTQRMLRKLPPQEPTK